MRTGAIIQKDHCLWEGHPPAVSHHQPPPAGCKFWRRHPLGAANGEDGREAWVKLRMLSEHAGDENGRGDGRRGEFVSMP
jgi:hypothetical protein